MKRLMMVALCGLTVGTIFATNWVEVEMKCPICKTTNEFLFLQSWGSYMFAGSLAQLQHINWLEVTSSSLYTCKKCKYSAFMWDFFIKERRTLRTIRRALRKLELPATNYSDCITKKLEAAEQTYKIYKHSDYYFWCRFYKIKGYHYARIGNVKQAEIERLKALEIAENLLRISSNEYRRKELLFITSSMKYFTNQYDEAIKDIDLALSLTYSNPDIDSIRNSRLDSYFTRQLEDLRNMTKKYIEVIEVIGISMTDPIIYFTKKENVNPQTLEIEKITDLEQAKQILKDVVIWCDSIDDIQPNNNGDIVFKIAFRNGKEYFGAQKEGDVWYFEDNTRRFYAYYPQEDILILKDWYSERSFNLTTGEEDVGNPGDFIFSPSQKRRLSRHNIIGMHNYYFIQEKIDGQYQKTFPLSNEFYENKNFRISYILDAFWENDVILYFIIEVQNKKSYYKVVLE